MTRATRDDLLRAAARIFAQQGFHNANLQDVAREAELTTGAIYSNFRGKHDLFLSAFEFELAAFIRDMNEARTGASPMERLVAVADQWLAFVSDRPERFLLFLEFLVFALRDPVMRPAVGERLGALRDATARIIEDEARSAGVELPVPAAQLSIAVGALSNGMALEGLLNPEAVSRELYVGVLSRLLLVGGEIPAGWLGTDREEAS